MIFILVKTQGDNYRQTKQRNMEAEQKNTTCTRNPVMLSIFPPEEIKNKTDNGVEKTA